MDGPSSALRCFHISVTHGKSFWANVIAAALWVESLRVSLTPSSIYNNISETGNEGFPSRL